MDILIAFSILQSFTLFITIFFIKKGVLWRYLQLIILIWGLNSIEPFFIERGLIIKYPHTLGLSFVISLIFLPLFYNFFNFLTSTSKDKNLYFHFTPLYLFLLYKIPFYTQTSHYKIEYYQYYLVGKKGDLFEHFFISIITIFYLILIIKSLLKYRKKILNLFSNIDKIDLNWILYFIFGVLIISILSIIKFLIPINSDIINIIVIFLSNMWLYGLIYLLLSQKNETDKFNNSSPLPTLPAKSIVEIEKKYSSTGLNIEDSKEIFQLIKKEIENKELFLDPKLSLKNLSNLTGYSLNQISQSINQNSDQNFYSFINSYRIDFSKKLLLKSDLNILEIVYKSGFQSKSTFNTNFKKFENLTPKQFRDKNNLSL